MATVAEMAIALNARVQKFVTGMRKATSSMGKFQKKAKKTNFITKGFNASLVGLAKVVGAVGVGRAFVALGRKQEMFQRALIRSQAIISDMDDALRATMKDTAIEVARTTIFSAEETAKSFFFLASAGLNAQQSIAALPFVSKFAQAGMFDMALATDLLTDAQSALGLTVKNTEQNMLNMARVGDVLVKANTLANASVQQFSEALTTKAGAALKILNKDIEEGVAVLAAFADQGLKASEAGTGLNIVLRDLTTKAIRNAGAFRRMGIRVFDQTGTMNNLADIIGDVERRLKGMSNEQAKGTLLTLGFTDKSVIFLQTLIGMSQRIREYEEGLRKAGGTTSSVASKNITPLQLAFADLDATLTRVSASMSSFISGLATLVRAVDKGFKKLVLLSFLPSFLAGDIRNVRIDKGGKFQFTSKAEQASMKRVALRAAEIDAARAASATGVGGANGKGQRVNDPQVQTTNDLLRELVRKINPVPRTG